MGIEDNIGRSLFNVDRERTFIDKLLAKDDVKRIGELVKKSPLTRAELLEILYLISGTESKLLNYSTWDRYIVLKFFVWIREFIKSAELLYDYEERLVKLQITDTNLDYYMENSKRMMEHNAKFLIDLYLNIGRTSLSIGATGILEMLKNRFELTYDTRQQSIVNSAKTGFFAKTGG